MHTPTPQTLHASLRRRLHNTLRAIALAGALLTLTATTAAAMPAQPSEMAGGQTSTIVRVIAPSSGFDWGDAGIGAGGALGISLVAIGGALAVSRRRGRRVRTSISPIG